MQTLEYTAQNNQWGTHIQVPDHVKTGKPFKGILNDVGSHNSFQVLIWEDHPDRYSVILEGDVSTWDGTPAKTVYHQNLQSFDSSISVIELKNGGVITIYGYKRRTSINYLFADGKLVELDGVDLYNLGLLEPNKQPIERPQLDTSSAFASNLKNFLKNKGGK